MWKIWGFQIVLTLLLGSAVAVTSGDVDPAVNLASVTEVWSDVWRDVDQFGMQLTRVSDQEEMRLGKTIAAVPEDDAEKQAILARFRDNAQAAIANLPKLIAQEGQAG